MEDGDRQTRLDELAAEVRGCTRCRLAQQRTHAVPGEGHPETEVVFVGEGPGFNEDREGRPFVGAAGGLLNELLGAIGWQRQEVFITNVVKCRPPGNRDPEPDEIAACAPYLQRQLEVLDPALIVTLGRHSLRTFMPGERISSAHGTLRPVDPATGAANALTYALYHPAAALRQASLRQVMLNDMAGIPEALLEARSRRALIGQAPTAQAQPDLPPPPEIGAASPPTVDSHTDAVAVATAAGVDADPENQMELF